MNDANDILVILASVMVLLANICVFLLTLSTAYPDKRKIFLSVQKTLCIFAVVIFIIEITIYLR